MFRGNHLQRFRMLLLLIFLGCALCNVLAAQEKKIVSVTLDDFDSTAAWTTLRDSARMKAEYSQWEMVIDPNGHNGSCLRLGFTLIASSADIWGTFNIEEPIDSVGIWIQNVTKRPVTFSLTLSEKERVLYVSKSVQLALDGEWHHLNFPFDSFTSAPWGPDTNGQFDYPVTRIVPAISGMPPGEPVVLRMDELSVTRSAPARLKLVKLTAPKTAVSGSKTRVSASVVPTEPVKNAKCELLLMRNGTVQARADVTPKSWTVGKVVVLGPAIFSVPQRPWPGKSEVVFRMNGVRITNHEDGVIGTVQIPAPKILKPSYSVRMLNGTPQLFEGNKPINSTGFMYENPNPEQVIQFAKAGVHLYFLECRQMGWIGNDKYDYKLIDDLMAELFVCDPQARVIPFFYVDLAAPMVSPDIDWWQNEHREDLCIDENGKVFSRYGHETVSFASEAWRRDTDKTLEKFIQHMENSPYADRIVGYQPSAGGSYEWMYHGGQDSVFLDYSKPTVKAFRIWLKEKYAGDEQKLQSAWKDNSVTFETAMIPPQAKRERSSVGNLRDPALEASVIDYYTFLSELTVDTIDHYCAVIKRATKGRKIAGVFYGYVMEQMYGGFCTQHTGHFAFGKLLKSKNVDFLMSPTSYWERQPGGSGGHMTAMASVRLHRKLWIAQADLRTFLSDKASGYGRCDTEEQSVGVIRREFAMDLTAGIPVYWYSFSIPWFGPSKPLMTNIQTMAKIDKQANERDRSLNGNKLAVIVSDSPAAYLGLPAEPARSLVYLQRENLFRSGVPFDIYLDSDIGNPDMPKYKAYLFLDSIHLTDKTRKSIDTLKKDGRVLAFAWAQGIVGDTLSIVNASSLCGINLALNDSAGVATIKPSEGYGPVYGSEAAFSPMVYPDDPNAETIGILQSPASLIGKPGLSVKKISGWTSIYSAAPRLSPEVIRTIAGMAGIQVYATGNDPVYIGNEYIGIHAKDAGTRNITLPHPAKVIDCFTGKTISNKSTSFSVKMDAYSTGIYRLVW